ncbi:amine sulfotransferase-like [Centruroides vittatus]|uniref:amine sulfotransferase-like n=1 Tax=Centruroides vittatus TaxID=120091 RepID=UPI00351069E0
MEKDTRKKVTLQNINGFLISTRFRVENLQRTVAFKPRDDDIFVAGYPKSGTTWTQYIVWSIVNKGAALPDVNRMWLREVPHLEMTGVEGIENLRSPRLLKVNLPFNLTPYNPSSKYIYVYRNPWDSCVSAFNMFKQVDENFSNGTFADYFECFIRGRVSHGDYFDHLLSWYARWNDPNFLFMTYEEMKRNTREVVSKMARFLGQEYHEMLTNNREIFEGILGRIQFDQMKQSLSLELSYADGRNLKKIDFFHSGKIGQWDDYFTEDQKKRLREKFIDKLSETKMLSLWKASDIFLE